MLSYLTLFRAAHYSLSWYQSKLLAINVAIPIFQFVYPNFTFENDEFPRKTLEN